MKSMRTRYAWLLLCALAAACGDAPEAALGPEEAAVAGSGARGGAQRLVYEDMYELDGVVMLDFGCDEDGNFLEYEFGELIRLYGRIHDRVMTVTSPAGGTHLTLQSRMLGTYGIGVDTGEEFRVQDSQQGMWQETMRGDVGRFEWRTRLRGTTGRTFVLVFGGYFRTDESGAGIVERDRLKVECRV